MTKAADIAITMTGSFLQHELSATAEELARTIKKPSKSYVETLKNIKQFARTADHVIGDRMVSKASGLDVVEITVVALLTGKLALAASMMPPINDLELDDIAKECLQTLSIAKKLLTVASAFDDEVSRCRPR